MYRLKQSKSPSRNMMSVNKFPSPFRSKSTMKISNPYHVNLKQDLKTSSHYKNHYEKPKVETQFKSRFITPLILTNT